MMDDRTLNRSSQRLATKRAPRSTPSSDHEHHDFPSSMNRYQHNGGVGVIDTTCRVITCPAFIMKLLSLCERKL